MKANWTRLSRMILNLGGNTRFMESRFNRLFMRHHKNACEIVIDRAGIPMAAVYFTPAGKPAACTVFNGRVKPSGKAADCKSVLLTHRGCSTHPSPTITSGPYKSATCDESWVGPSSESEPRLTHFRHIHSSLFRESFF